MKKASLIISLILISSIVLTACQPAATPATIAPATIAPTTTALATTVPAATAPATTAPTEGEKTFTVCVSWNEEIHSQIRAWKTFMEEYSAVKGPENGLKFNWIHTVANGDAVQQANNIQDCINQKVDAIVVRAQDSGTIGASITAAKAANIPILLMDREAASDGPQPTAFIGEDTYKQAFTTATAFAKLLKEKGVQGKCVEFLGDQLDKNAVNRSNAYHDVEKSEGAWVTVAQVPTEWKPEKFYSGGLNAFQAHPEANCIYTASDFTFSSIANALQAVDKYYVTGDPKHVWIAGEDIHPQGYDAMVAKYYDLGTTFEVYDQAVLVVDVLIKISHSEPVDLVNLVSGRLATWETVAQMDNLYARDYRD
jgi:ribose transport system substrate-binding protein